MLIHHGVSKRRIARNARWFAPDWIAELFRFVTTSVMARYVDYLVAQRTTETRA